MESETSNTEMHDTAEDRSPEDRNSEESNSEESNSEGRNSKGRIAALIARLAAVVELLERVLPRPEMAATALAAEAVGPIVAMVEGGSREAELAHKLANAEKTIADLRASSVSREGRRTLPVSLLAKQDGSAPEPGALDAALLSLSLEQRIAVKAQLLRSGLI